MTNKEAREIIRTIGLHTPVVHTGIKDCHDFYKAIDLAIKALEREADLEQAVVNIKMSEEEIKQFKQMLQEHTPLYTITSDTFVEGASVNRPQGEFTIDELKKWLYEIAYNNNNDFGKDCLEIVGRLDGFENFIADMRGGRE